METESERIPTLHEHLVETGACQLQQGLQEHGLVPATFLDRLEEVLHVCRTVEAEWLRGELAFTLFRDVLQEVHHRLKTKEEEEEQAD